MKREAIALVASGVCDADDVEGNLLEKARSRLAWHSGRLRRRSYTRVAGVALRI